MTSAIETFAIELGRAAKKSAHLLRGFTKADRDDALSAAMLSCWERRTAFNQEEQPLDEWFQDALQVSARYVKRSQRSQHYTEMKLSEITTNDATSRDAETAEAYEHLMGQLSREERSVARMLGKGFSVRAIATKLDAPLQVVRRTVAHIRKMNALLPDAEIEHQRGSSGPRYDGGFDRAPAPIDHSIEQLLRRPTNPSADCVPCWKCMYFEGWAPARYHPTPIVDEKIRLAVHATEARKIAIANG